jgi:RimJ/RimL family protein N-acetyltransferase
LAHGRTDFGLRRIVAITASDNAASIGLLVKLGFEPERKIRLAANSEELELYALAT